MLLQDRTAVLTVVQLGAECLLFTNFDMLSEDKDGKQLIVFKLADGVNGDDDGTRGRWEEFVHGLSPGSHTGASMSLDRVPRHAGMFHDHFDCQVISLTGPQIDQDRRELSILWIPSLVKVWAERTEDYREEDEGGHRLL